MHSAISISYKLRVHSKPLVTPEHFYKYLLSIWDPELVNVQEQFYIVYLNKNYEAICWHCLGTGTGDSVLVDIRLAVAIGLQCLASKMVLAHNHPGRTLNPSPGDVEATESLRQAAQLFGIQVIDHIIITDRGFTSMRRKGFL